MDTFLLTWCPITQLCFAATSSGLIQAWDIKQRELIRVFAGHRDVVTSLSLGASGLCLVSGSLDTTVRLWDLQRVGLIQRSRIDGKEEKEGGRGWGR